MASLTFRFEREPVFDVAEQLIAAHEALAKRHGDRFRKLEREIEAAVGADIELGDEDLGEGHFVLTPPASWGALLQRCREIGVAR